MDHGCGGNTGSRIKNWNMNLISFVRLVSNWSWQESEKQTHNLGYLWKLFSFAKFSRMWVGDWTMFDPSLIFCCCYNCWWIVLHVAFFVVYHENAVNTIMISDNYRGSGPYLHTLGVRESFWGILATNLIGFWGFFVWAWPV